MAILENLDFDDDDDIGISQKSEFYIVITLESDADQRRLLDYLLDEGYLCRALAL